MSSYDTRLIVSGAVSELYVYETTIFRGYSLGEGKHLGRRNIASDEDKPCNRDKVLSRASKNVRRLINANRGSGTVFVTLTYADNIKDLDAANADYNRFIKRLTYAVGRPLQWLVVPEFQRRGAVHYHAVIFNLGYMPNKRLGEVWGHGFVKINRVQDVDNLGAYVSKYMSKGAVDDRLEGRRCWWRSRGLREPEEITDWDEIENRLGGRSPKYTANYVNEHIGAIHYQQYIISDANDKTAVIKKSS